MAEPGSGSAWNFKSQDAPTCSWRSATASASTQLPQQVTARASRQAAARRLVCKDLGLYRAVRTDAPAQQSAGEALLACSGALWLASAVGG